ncbi:hypothetical protein AB0J63_02485 [Streptosporangium canum]
MGDTVGDTVPTVGRILLAGVTAVAVAFGTAGAAGAAGAADRPLTSR